MIVECGYWDIDTKSIERYGHRYFVCRHRFNPTKIELVFIKRDGATGRKEFVETLKKENLI